MSSHASWIAVDWGTTHLRAWAMDPRGSILDHVKSRGGMGGLSSDQFEATLLGLIGGWLGPGTSTTVLACGMVGARQGWIEADYVETPTSPVTRQGFTEAPTTDPRIRVFIIPGIKQRTPPDVMRGEETQIAGVLATRSDFEGIICMPGTHSKWAHVSDGQVVGFRTAMTGELFALLSKHSILRHSVSATEDEKVDVPMFEQTVENAMQRPGTAFSELFSVRAGQLLDNVPSAVGSAKLSGLLIAAEIEAMRSVWRGRRVLLFGAQALVDLYARALTVFGVETEMTDGRDVTVAGLRLAHYGLGVQVDA